MEKIRLTSEARNQGKAKVLRREGGIPAVVYGQGKKTISLSLNSNEFEKVFREAGTSQIIRLSIGEEKKNVLIHKVDRHPVSGKAIHIDFYEISMKEKITTEVPLVFTGDSTAVIEMSGTLVTNKDAVEIECLPGDLPPEIEVDISSLTDFDAVIHVSDLRLPQGVEVKEEPEAVIAFVEAPRSEEEMAELEEPVETPEMPESETGGEAEAETEAQEEKSEE